MKLQNITRVKNYNEYLEQIKFAIDLDKRECENIKNDEHIMNIIRHALALINKVGLQVAMEKGWDEVFRSEDLDALLSNPTLLMLVRYVLIISHSFPAMEDFEEEEASDPSP